ncbi:cobyrinate a,c-diamide synthase [Sporomusaceae bacterium FL31]|nr:Cobyrinate a,c-diamide synthase [Sporomusaceae bacterium FL31]GCE33483.1 cobyrinate a,c-diamide synthase [Sporomusaceae bacterium]
MDHCHIPRLVIAATNSGAGKTTIVTGILANLKKKGLSIQSYKVGPDYIDPGYHALASGKPGHNLDSWLIPSDQLEHIFIKTAKDNDIVIIEGVMGLFDGGRDGISSTAAIAKLLKAPVVLVIDVKSMGESAAAIAHGFKTYDPDVNLAGVIINRVGSESHRLMVCSAVERLGIPVLGCIGRNEKLSLPERHLGLTPVTEHVAEETLSIIADQLSQQVNIAELIKIAQTAPPLYLKDVNVTTKLKPAVRIGVAEDEAFTFYYPESLDVLKALGAELIPFSPLNDDKLPIVDGIILGGGFPEMFVGKLTKNASMRQAIFAAGKKGLPIYAECGGLMYLTSSISDFSGEIYEMVGLVPAISQMCKKLQSVGYIEAKALQDNLLCSANENIRGHEFHFSQMIPIENNDPFPWAFEFKKVRTGAVYPGGYAAKNILASYLHMHFAGNTHLAENFVQKCKEFQSKRSPIGG